MAKIFNNHKSWAFDKPNLSTQSLSANVRGLFFGGGDCEWSDIKYRWMVHFSYNGYISSDSIPNVEYKSAR